jgi:hypothetical protein
MTALLTCTLLTASIELHDLNQSRRLGITIEEYRERLAAQRAADLAASARYYTPAPDEEHYEPRRRAVNTGERRVWE